jgi:hypothetical protein
MSRFFLGAATVVLLSAMMAGGAAGKDKQGLGPGAWIGAWSAGPEQDISIALSADGFMIIDGFASWGASDPERVERGAINIGEFAVRVPVEWIDRRRNKLDFAVSVDGSAVRPAVADDYDCIVTLFLADRGLRAEDNGMCGGHNVTFTGDYTHEQST